MWEMERWGSTPLKNPVILTNPFKASWMPESNNTNVAQNNVPQPILQDPRGGEKTHWDI